MFEDDKQIIGRSKSKVRQNIDQLKRTNKQNNGLHNTTQKDGEIRCPGRVGSFISTSGTFSVTIVTNSVIRNV
jgi:hypothetical protein